MAEGKQAYVEGDFQRAFKEFLPLAEAGDQTMQNQIAAMYYAGQGVAQDYAKAAEWFRRSAREGSADGQYLLGKLYYHGQGVERNFEEAHKWLLDSATRGKASAQYLLASLYLSGQGVERNEMRAYFWSVLAAGAAEMPEEERLGAKSLAARIESGLTRRQVDSVREMVAKWSPKRKKGG